MTFVFTKKTVPQRIPNGKGSVTWSSSLGLENKVPGQPPDPNQAHLGQRTIGYTLCARSPSLTACPHPAPPSLGHQGTLMALASHRVFFCGTSFSFHPLHETIPQGLPPPPSTSFLSTLIILVITFYHSFIQQ